MNPRSTAILFVVALLLGAFVYFYEIEGEPDRREAEESSRRVFAGIEASDIESISLVTSDEIEVTLVPREGRWRVTAPIDFPADEVAADGIAGSLTKLTSEGTIDDPQGPEVYGLGEGARIVRFTAGGEEHSLRVGRKTPVGSNSYVRSGSDERVFMVPTWRLNSFSKRLDELRDRRVLRFDPSSVSRVEVRWPGAAVELERRDAGWWLTAPVEGLGDSDTIEDLLSELSFLRADGFLDEERSAAGAGLDPAELDVVLTITPDEGEPRSLAFALGQVGDAGDRLARGSESTLYRVAAERIDDFPRKVVDYRFKELARFESADARRFEIDFSGAGGTGRVTGLRGESGWSTEPEPMAAGKASSLVRELSRLKARDIAAEEVGETELAALGLEPPIARFRVFADPAEEGGEEVALADVALGVTDPELGIVARSGSGGPIFRIEHELAEHLPVSFEAFRNRFVSAEEEEEVEALPDEFSEDPALLEDEAP